MGSIRSFAVYQTASIEKEWAMPEENYLDILEQSLKKKLGILNQIRVKNEHQRVLLLDEELAPEDFEENIASKAALVEELELLDQGFEDVYERIRQQLDAHKEQYKDQIRRLQDLIRQVTAESSNIQVEERRNYKLAEKKFSSVKKQVREVKASYKAVNQYYRSMTKTSYVDAQFMDNKK